jgi:hypothetical protein
MATNLEYINKYSVKGRVENFDFSPFSSAYDIYKIHYRFVATSSTGYIGTRLLDSSDAAIAAASEYHKAAHAMRSYDTFFDNHSKTATSGTEVAYNQDYGAGGEITIFNPYDSDKFTSWLTRSAGGTTITGQLFGYQGLTMHVNAEQINGMRFYAGGGGSNGFESGEVRVYGVK